MYIFYLYVYTITFFLDAPAYSTSNFNAYFLLIYRQAFEFYVFNLYSATVSSWEVLKLLLTMWQNPVTSEYISINSSFLTLHHIFPTISIFLP